MDKVYSYSSLIKVANPNYPHHPQQYPPQQQAERPPTYKDYRNHALRNSARSAGTSFLFGAGLRAGTKYLIPALRKSRGWRMSGSDLRSILVAGALTSIAQGAAHGFSSSVDPLLEQEDAKKYQEAIARGTPLPKDQRRLLPRRALGRFGGTAGALLGGGLALGGAILSNTGVPVTGNSFLDAAAKKLIPKSPSSIAGGVTNAVMGGLGGYFTGSTAGRVADSVRALRRRKLEEASQTPPPPPLQHLYPPPPPPQYHRPY